MPILLLATLGFIDLSGALQSRSAANHLTGAGGRMASVAGNDPMADQLILARMAKETSGLGVGRVDYVVIWHATGPGATVPTECRPSTTAWPNTTSSGVSDGGTDLVGACNVYIRPRAVGGAFTRATTNPSASFGCMGPNDPLKAQKLDCMWPAANRRAVTSPRDFLGTAAPTDYIGVHVEVSRTLHAPLLPDLTFVDSAITLIEPHGYEL